MTDAVVWISPCGVPSYTTAPPYWPAPGRSPGQGGGMDSQLNEKPTRAPIPNEAGNGLKNEPGTIAMARTSDPHSASAQFFINVADNNFLNYRAPSGQGWGYAVFGRVTRGMDVVNRIAKTRTTSRGMNQDVPVTPVVIEKATLLPN